MSGADTTVESGAAAAGAHGKHRKKKHKAHGGDVIHDDGEGSWLVSYADLMTLLFGFFVVIASFSKPDAKKVEELKQHTAQAMGGTYTQPYSELSEALKNVLRDFHLEKDVVINATDEGLELVFKGTMFFESGSAEMIPNAQNLMTQISGILVKQAKNFLVMVEGHTDDVPIESRAFPSNWELSSSRAGTVVRLLEANGFPHQLLRPIGLADTHPIVPNRTPAGEPIPHNQAENRRILLRIQKQTFTREVEKPGKKATKDSSGQH